MLARSIHSKLFLAKTLSVSQIGVRTYVRRLLPWVGAGAFLLCCSARGHRGSARKSLRMKVRSASKEESGV